MYEHVNERIKVVAVFGNGYKDVRPFKAQWGEKEIIVRKIGYVHKLQEGRAVRHVFSISDGVNFYEFIFDAADLSWLIGRVSDNEAN